MDMVAVEEEQVLGLILTKTPETLVGLVEVVAVELASLQVMAVHKIQVDMEVQEMADHPTKMEKVKQVVMHHLTLVVAVVQVVNMEKEEDKQDLVEMEAIEMTLHKVVMLEVPTEVEEVHQVVMDMV